MKRFALFAGLILALSLCQSRAQQDADDQYVIIYSLMEQADSLQSSGQLNQALAGYIEAQNELQKFQKVYPDWNPKIVNFRLNYLADKIAGATAQLPVTNAPPMVTNTGPVSGGDLTQQLNALNAQIRQLQSANETLQLKLKEAVTAQPAVVDADEFANLQEQVRALAKENDLLKVDLAQGRANTNTAAQIESGQLQQALAGQTAIANKLALENQSLQARARALQTDADAAEALREENALLKKEVANLNGNPDLVRARAQIAQLQSDAAVSWLEKAALENRIQRMQEASVSAAPVSTAPDQAENEARIRGLTQERDDLLAKLGEANKKLYGRKNQDAAAQIDALAEQVDTLRARVSVDEAQAVPYTPEELALFKQPAPQLANPDAEKKSIRELPGGTATLVAEAQNYYSGGQYDKAGADYQEILKRDEKNPLALANLAAIEVQQKKMDDAEKHIKAALAQNPDDAYNLFVLGQVRFNQARYDDALDALSRAAKLDPQNPQIQNYLGVVLAQKGLRAQAETAFRRAVELDPGYADAHKNLAVIYLGQQPPLVELARWHYQKALDAGMPPDPALEKMLDETNAPATSQ